jgi:hypothetical protein
MVRQFKIDGKKHTIFKRMNKEDYEVEKKELDKEREEFY